MGDVCATLSEPQGQIHTGYGARGRSNKWLGGAGTRLPLYVRKGPLLSVSVYADSIYVVHLDFGHHPLWNLVEEVITSASVSKQATNLAYAA